MRKNVTPLRIISDLLRLDSEPKEVAIYQSFSTMESRNSVTVTVVRDGYLDDSIRGEWNEFEMTKNADQTWKIISAKQAGSC